MQQVAAEGQGRENAVTSAAAQVTELACGLLREGPVLLPLARHFRLSLGASPEVTLHT